LPIARAVVGEAPCLQDPRYRRLAPCLPPDDLTARPLPIIGNELVVIAESA